MWRPATWLALLLAVSDTSGNAINNTIVQDLAPSTGRSIFGYHRNGLKIDVRVLPAANTSVTSRSSRSSNPDDDFPKFPLKDVGHCILEFSYTCAQKRVARFLDEVNRLKEITLIGQSVKLVKMRNVPEERLERTFTNVGERIDKSVDDFFDMFGLRVTLPKWDGKRNQIDVMMDDQEIVEGRGDKGGGGGGCKMKGGKKGGKGGKGGGGCKKMVMMMVMGLKAKMMGMIGMAAMKGMFMSMMSLMISKMMILSKLMGSKGGMFGGFGGFGGKDGGGYGGGGGGGGGGQLKEVILLTKAPSALPAGNFGGGPPPDTYGAPPPTGGGGDGGYNYPSGGGGGGGGWGRSFDRKPMSFVKEYIYRDETVDEPVQIRPISDEKWNQDVDWSYTTEAAVLDQVKASQEINKQETIIRSDHPVRANSLQPIYAKKFRNYIEARNGNSEIRSEYDM